MPPSHHLELPSTGQDIQFRPFLVKEGSYTCIGDEDTKQITTAIKTVIKNCIKTRGIKVEQLPTFDIEYLFLNIRGKSVGEEIEVNIICPDDNETSAAVTINLDDIKVQKTDEHTNQIKVDDEIMLEMRYPSLEEFIKNYFDFSGGSDLDQSFELIASCIDKMYTADEVWSIADCTKKKFVSLLSQ